MSSGLAPGVELDRYRLVSPLGEGGMASVWLAEHADLGTPCAIKILHVVSTSIAERMLQEGRIQARLDHPNVVHVHDVVRWRGFPALVMEHVRGPTLDTLLRNYRPNLTQADALAIGILDGVHHAHATGLIHRDLKPANILVSLQRGQVVPKVADFGLAKVLGGETGSHTRSGAALGTPTFMPPEQVRDAKNVDERADVFALGAILYELVTGIPALRGDDLIGVFEFAREERWRPVRDLVPSAPSRMVTAVERALKADPDERWPTVEALRSAWLGTAPPTEAQLRAAWEPEHIARLELLAAPATGPAAAPAPDGPGHTAAPPDATLDIDAAPSPTAAVDQTADMPIDDSPFAAHQPGQTAVPDSLDALLPDMGEYSDIPYASQPPPRPTTNNSRSSALPTVLLLAGALVLVIVLGVGAGVMIMASISSDTTPSPSVGDVMPSRVPPPPSTESTPPGPAAPTNPTDTTAAAAPPSGGTPASGTRTKVRVEEPKPAPKTKVVVPSGGESTADDTPSSASPTETPPPPAEAEPTTASVELIGVSRGSLITADGRRFPLDAAPPGRYTLHVSFAPGTSTPVLEVTLRAGETRTVTCEPGMRLCT